MAWGISPRKIATLTLGGYNADHYLTLFYHAAESLDWHVSYFNHDGIIAYTNISWASYAEEVSMRIAGNRIHIKSECVGYQGLFTDYGKNEHNLELLFGEINVRQSVLADNLPLVSQQLMDSISDNQFVQIDDPPLAGKEKLTSFWSWFYPQQKYFITPLLAILNVSIYIITRFAFAVINIAALERKSTGINTYQKLYAFLGFSDRSAVLHGEVWLLLTNTFLHFNFLHLAGNMIVLVYAGAMVESRLGKWNFLFMYLCTGIVASMSSVIWREVSISAGASGAIFGLFGIMLALATTNFYEQHARRAILISTAIFTAYNILPFGEKTDHLAHFGGLVSGYIFGWIAFLSLKKEHAIKQYYSAALSLVMVIIFVGCGLLFTVDFKVERYHKLTADYGQLSYNIYQDFYNYRDTTREQKLSRIRTFALPKLKSYAAVADSLVVLPLPSKTKKEALMHSKIIKLQCSYYKLLYLELRDRSNKYRPQITAATDAINKLRAEAGKNN